MIDQDKCNCDNCPLAVKGQPVPEVCGHTKRVGIGFCRECQTHGNNSTEGKI